MNLPTSLPSACLLLCFLILSINAPLQAQQPSPREKWMGLHNIAFEDRTETADYETQTQRFDESIRENRFSIGLHYRRFLQEGRYYQLDLLAFDSEKDDINRQVYSLSSGDFLFPSGYEERRRALRIGYRIGQIVPIGNRLTADIAIGSHPSYQRMETTPYSPSEFPKTLTSWGLELKFHAGLNYRIHKRINIGCHISLLDINYYYRKNTLANPAIPAWQREGSATDFNVRYLNTPLNSKCIFISYVLPTKGL